ncbi:hypothetical protein OSB04_021614 [Centaurea solstitialis]|uniref:C2 domain-containing protein n=1 Tax=Centaurea solstitialis TaxID=347529 RepID=A0AA38T5U7_9ASTR|nr:hypothetical protein OSB04_021614 [Centaurea solstitialis]
MAVSYELEVTISSAKNLENVNWRHGPLKPYAVAWVDPENKHSTRVDEQGDESPIWDQKLVIPIKDPIEESTLYIDIFHANAAEDTKPFIGSARLKLKDVVDEVGIGEFLADDLKLKRPSGRPHGKVEVKVRVKGPCYRAPDPYYAPQYCVPPLQNYPTAPPPYGGNYPNAPPQPCVVMLHHYAVPPPQNYAPYIIMMHHQWGIGIIFDVGKLLGSLRTVVNRCTLVNHRTANVRRKRRTSMGWGVAVGTVAVLLGGLAIAKGADSVEYEIIEDRGGI